MHSEKEKTIEQKCTKCDFTFKTLDQLSEHDKGHTELQPEQFQCDKCENAFRSISILQEHVKLHDESKKSSQIRCMKCGEQLVSNEKLKIHNEKHLQFIPCKFMPNCQHGERCYYSHEPRVANVFPCFECGEKFDGIKT